MDDIYDLFSEIKNLTPDCRWILFSLYECFKLVRTYKSDLATESICVNTNWRMIQTVFENSCVDCTM